MAAPDLHFDVDSRGIISARDNIKRGQRQAAESSVAATTKWLERDLEAVTRGAVRGKLWRAWGSSFYPNPDGQPAGEVYVNGGPRSRGAMIFWSGPGRTVGKQGQWLAIPSDAVPRRGRRRQALTPVEVEAEFNSELEFIPAGNGNKYPTLNLIGVTNGRSGAYRPMTARRAAADRRRGTVREAKRIVMFTLIPQLAFGNAYSIEPSVRRAGTMLGDEYVTRMSKMR